MKYNFNFQKCNSSNVKQTMPTLCLYSTTSDQEIILVEPSCYGRSFFEYQMRKAFQIMAHHSSTLSQLITTGIKMMKIWELKKNCDIWKKRKNPKIRIKFELICHLQLNSVPVPPQNKANGKWQKQSFQLCLKRHLFWLQLGDHP